jgi:hypothetical protein
MVYAYLLGSRSSFRELKNQMRIRFTVESCFWKNDTAAVHAVGTIQYNHSLFYLLL